MVLRHLPKNRLPIVKENVKWSDYSGENTGFLDVYYCDPRSKKFPVRDVRNIKGRNKQEPHYEDKTFNFFASCNQPLLRGQLKQKTSYVFFLTKYTGLLKNYKNQYFITGFYKIGKIGLTNNGKPRFAIKASKIKFVSIEEALPYENLVNHKILNPRWEKKTLTQMQVQKLLNYFKKTSNATKKYSNETKELMQY